MVTYLIVALKKNRFWIGNYIKRFTLDTLLQWTCALFDERNLLTLTWMIHFYGLGNGPGCHLETMFLVNTTTSHLKCTFILSICGI